MTTFKAVRVGTKLLSVNSDAKTIKGNGYGVLTAILYLAPSNSSGRNVCPHASPIMGYGTRVEAIRRAKLLARSKHKGGEFIGVVEL